MFVSSRPCEFAYLSSHVICVGLSAQDVTQDTASRFPILYQETMTVGRRHFILTQLKWLMIVSFVSPLICVLLSSVND